jgi:hypothetical protein
MPLTPQQRADMLRFFAADCSDKDLKEIRSFVEAEVSRRVSRRLIHLIPGETIHFREGDKINSGTLLRIHRRSLVIEQANGETGVISAERLIDMHPSANPPPSAAPLPPEPNNAAPPVDEEPPVDPRSVQLPDELI